MSDSVRHQRWQPTRLPCSWDSPGKNTGVGCHFLLQCMKVKRESEVTQSCPTLSEPMDCSPPGSSVHGIFQTRALEWVPLPSPYDYLNQVSLICSVVAWHELNDSPTTLEVLCISAPLPLFCPGLTRLENGSWASSTTGRKEDLS